MTLEKEQRTKNSMSFPAIKGKQAKQEYYVVMCPLELLPQLFKSHNEQIPTKLIEQRNTLASNITPISQYITDNTNNYILSSVVVTIDKNATFKPYKEKDAEKTIGSLHIPFGSNFLINDGQHRIEALLEAIKHKPSLKKETLSIVLFVDLKFRKSQQMFVDLNKQANNYPKIQTLAQDKRNPLAKLVNTFPQKIFAFKGMIEIRKSSLSNRSSKLFTLSSVYRATQTLLKKNSESCITKKDYIFALEFWGIVAETMPEWKKAAKKQITTSFLRKNYIHSHGIFLQAIATVGVSLLLEENWKQTLLKINTLNWSRTGKTIWEGRALKNGVIKISKKNIILTANLIKKHLDMPLTPTEKTTENDFLRKSV